MEYIDAAYKIVVAIAALLTVVISWKNKRAIEVVHKATNSMKDELVVEVRAAATAKGKAEGIAEERADPQKSAST